MQQSYTEVVAWPTAQASGDGLRRPLVNFPERCTKKRVHRNETDKNSLCELRFKIFPIEARTSVFLWQYGNEHCTTWSAYAYSVKGSPSQTLLLLSGLPSRRWNIRLRPFQNFRLLNIKGMKFGCSNQWKPWSRNPFQQKFQKKLYHFNRNSQFTSVV